MKFTTKILVLIFMVMIAGLLSSNMILKKQYDAIDKTDVYWTYDKVLEQPFKHLNITGGNETNIYYEPAAKPSVRLLQEWVKYHNGAIKAEIHNDTLFLNFDYKPANAYEKFWLQSAAPVRIFSPELLSVTGNNTHFEMDKLKQKTVSVSMRGKSSFEIETMYRDMDSVNIYQSDSSSVKFEISPDIDNKPSDDKQPAPIVVQSKQGGGTLTFQPPTEQKIFNENMSIRSVTATIRNYSILDIGHAQIQNLQTNVMDSSAIVLSGNALKKVVK